MTTLKTHLKNLEVEYQQPIKYWLRLDEQENILLNEQIGRSVTVRFLGEIACCHCGRKIKKTFNNGYCYPCFQRLPQNDLCYVRPNLCHFHQGTCRDSQFGLDYCHQPHIVYLAGSNHVKVGITNQTHQTKRWMDQGAGLGMVIAVTPSRKIAGEIEELLSRHLPDKTNWRQMLSNDTAELNLPQIWKDVQTSLPENYLSYLRDAQQITKIDYPVMQYPSKVSTINLDKTNEFTSKLLGIKAQYLIFDNGVFNVKKHAGYLIEISLHEN